MKKKRHSPGKNPPRSSRPRWLILAAIVLALGCVWAVAWWRFHPKVEPAAYPAVISPGLRAVSTTPPGEGKQCAECHAKEVDEWRQSQHAVANRLFDPNTDLAAFNGSRIFSGNGIQTILGTGLKTPSFAIVQTDGSRAVFHPEAVIGVTPLVQYLASFPGGRLQVMNLAFDPEKKDWFDTQAPEVRRVNDWSYWQNRGMNWNSQCAFCHMTNLQKGYDPGQDLYRTTWDAMGIACAQCHGPMEKHVASPKDKALMNHQTARQIIDNCASCHARREELTGKFHAGESFNDHYRLSLPDQAGMYYPDGQVKEEDYEFGSFSMSRMGHKGISCLDCHNPHSGKLRAPVDNNALCMTCHTAPGQRGATPVDPITHGHHKTGTPGDRCVDCHMPVTRYMVRDPRRDHGFTIPDPVLTKELGVPNSCNRCHDDKSADWAIDFTNKWYGEKMDRRSRKRARAIARAENGDNGVVTELVDLAGTEEIAAWRSALTSLLEPWANQSSVRAFLEKSLTNESPLVRSAAARVLSGHSDAEAAALIRPLCDDPVRLVRLDAVWGLHERRDRPQPAYGELTTYLDNISDQPAGALRQTQFALDEKRMEDALKWSAKAVAWDANSGEEHQIRAVVLNMAGKREEAIAELKKACELDPKNAQHPFMLALLYGEAEQPDAAIARLKDAVTIDPSFVRAWYNLGLSQAQKEDLAGAIISLKKAEELQPGSPEFPYARATVHARAGQMVEARQAAERAQSLGYQPAAQLLQQLQ